MKIVIKWLVVFSAIAFVSGCSDDTAEKEKFRQQLLDKALNDDTRKDGDAFLAENLHKEGVEVTASGLQYRVITMGEGEKPGPRDIVTVHYEGKRVDGHIFDSSYKRGQPAEFPLNQVIQGWQEGLRLMPVGSVWELYIPADLAYGARSPAADIPPNSALIFKVELLNKRAPQ